MASMTMGEIARLAGVTTQTIRFYGREGLVPEPSRRASGYRQYGSESVQQVRFIVAGKEVGLRLLGTCRFGFGW
jgi:MerR family transcriptional regulator, copper efflux regulator